MMIHSQYIIAFILIGLLAALCIPTTYNTCNKREREIINTRKYEIINI